MTDTKSNLTFLKAMTLLFIGMKLTHHIDWSWWLVWMPFILEVTCTMAFEAMAEYLSRRRGK